jgi:hypothetical protein
MPTKDVWYHGVKFSREVIESAISVFSGLSSAVSYDSLTVEVTGRSGKESWSFEYLAEFYSEYRGNVSRASLWASNDIGSLRLQYSELVGATNISVDLPSRAAVEEVFDRFDSYVDGTK